MAEVADYDDETKYVYQAERSFAGFNYTSSSINDATHFIRTAEQFARELEPSYPPVQVLVYTDETNREPAYYDSNNHEIWLPVPITYQNPLQTYAHWSLNHAVLLHEVSHAVVRPKPGHGKEFRLAMIYLTTSIYGYAGIRLTERYRDYGLSL